MILGSILLIIALILSLRIKIIIAFKDSLSVYLGILFFRIRLFPTKFKKRKKKGPFRMSAKQAAKIRERVRQREEQKRLRRIQKAKEKEEKKKKALEDKEKQQEKPKGEGKIDLSVVLDILGAVRSLVTDLISVSLSHFRLDLARLHITVATEDAATTAIAYGSVCAALDSLLRALEPLKGFNAPKAKDISVDYDFLSEETKLDIKVVMSMRVWHGLHIGFTALRSIGASLFRRLIGSAQSRIPNAKQ